VLVTFVVDAVDADAGGYEPVMLDGERVGYVTSGGYGFRVGKSIAMAYVDREAAHRSDGFTIPVLGEPCAAVRVEGALYDPSGSRMRG